MNLFFVEKAYGVNVNIDASVNGVGILVDPSNYAGKGNVWNFEGIDVTVKNGYNDTFEIIEEFDNATVYADFDDLRGEYRNFYVVPHYDGYPFTPCYRFENFNKAMAKVNSL